MNTPSIPAPGRALRESAARPAARFESYGIRYGLMVGAAYVGFFLLMKVLGLHTHTEVAYANGIFLIAGIVLALRDYKRAVNGRLDYLPGLGLGFLVSLISSIVLALFFVLYSTIDKEFASHVMTSNLYGMSLSVLMIFLVIILHGTVAGTFVGFIAMQFFKRSDHQLNDPDMA